MIQGFQMDFNAERARGQWIQAQRDELHEMVYGPSDPFSELLKDHPELGPLSPKDTTMTDLKIKAGKCYRTRDGRKAHVLGARYDQHETFPMIGYIEGKTCPDSWTCSGQFFSSGPSHADLISEWKEPRSGEVWVAAFDDGLSERDGAVKFVTFRTEAEAKAAWFCGEKAFAIKGVTLTEGQGLTGEGSE